MPYVEQLCQEDVPNLVAQIAYTSFIGHAIHELGGERNDYYSGNLQSVPAIRIGRRDIVFVCQLDASTERVTKTSPDENAAKIARAVEDDLVKCGKGKLKVGVLLNHGICGWGESAGS